MKLVTALLLTCLMTLPALADEYDDGYADGWADCLAWLEATNNTTLLENVTTPALPPADAPSPRKTSTKSRFIQSPAPENDQVDPSRFIHT